MFISLVSTVPINNSPTCIHSNSPRLPIPQAVSTFHTNSSLFLNSSNSIEPTLYSSACIGTNSPLLRRDTECLTSSHDWSRYITSSRVHSFSNAYKEFYNEDPVVFNTVLKRFLEYLSKSNDSWYLSFSPFSHHSEHLILILLIRHTPQPWSALTTPPSHVLSVIAWCGGLLSPLTKVAVPVHHLLSYLLYKMNYNRVLLIRSWWILPFVSSFSGPPAPEGSFLDWRRNLTSRV